MIVHPQIEQGYMKTTKKKKEDITGRVFGRLTILGLSHQDANHRWHYRYRCACGREGSVAKNVLPNYKSCGKCIRGKWNKTHGCKNTPEYNVWNGIKSRCLNPNDKSFPRYGGKGIKVSEDWMKFEAFKRDMGARPGPDYEIDRIDTRGNYEKGNCRWATGSQNCSNRLASHFWHVKGLVFDNATDAARHFGVSDTTVHRWVRGFPDKRRGTVSSPRPDCHLVPKYENS